MLAKLPVPEGVVLVKEIPGDAPSLFVDPEQTGVALRNLIENALLAMPHGGKLTITAEPKVNPGRVRLRIADSGCGIPPEHLPRLFEAAVQHPDRRRRTGPAIARKLIEANHGSISAESESGRGRDVRRHVAGDPVGFGRPAMKAEPRGMGVRTRLTLLLTLLVLVFAAGALTIRILDARRIRLLTDDRTREKSALFGRLVELEGKSCKVFSYDYSFWDDMVKFVKTRELDWAHENIDEGLTTFGADAAWVLRTDYSTVFAAVGDGNESLTVLPLSQHVCSQVFEQTWFPHFWVETGPGLVEIWGGADSALRRYKAPDPAAGLLHGGQSLESGRDRRTGPAGGGRGEAGNRAVRRGQRATFFRQRCGPGRLQTCVERLEWRDDCDRRGADPVGRNLGAGQSIESAVPGCSCAGRGHPTAVVAGADELGEQATGLDFPGAGEREPGLVRPLEKRRNEFGNLARLIRGFFEQQERLVAEVAERKQAQAELARHEHRLEELIHERTRELKQAQEQLVRKERLAALGQAAGGIAHELRNPLAAIRNAAYYLNAVHGPTLPEKAVRNLATIEEQVERSSRIITNLLDFARGRPAEPEECRVENILREAVRRAALPVGVEVVEIVPGDLPRITVDPGQMVQVFLNLLVNAGQAMSNHGRVSIDCRLQITDYRLQNTNCRLQTEPGKATPEAHPASGAILQAQRSCERSDPAFVAVRVSDTG